MTCNPDPGLALLLVYSTITIKSLLQTKLREEDQQLEWFFPRGNQKSAKESRYEPVFASSCAAAVEPVSGFWLDCPCLDSRSRAAAVAITIASSGPAGSNRTA